MAAGTIDLASTYELLSVFDAGGPDKTYAWSWQQAVRITTILVGADHVQIAPNPGASGQATGEIGELLARLAREGLVADAGVGQHLRECGIRATREWVTGSATAIISELEWLATQESSFDAWVDWNVRGVWPEHARRLGGLFDATFLPEVARVLELSEADAYRLHRATESPEAMQALVRRGTATDEFCEVRNAWVVSTLIRGWFHDYMARLADHQIWHHPVRGGILPRSAWPSSRVIQLSEAELIYANIIVAGALDQKPADRGRWWADAVSKSRRRWKHLDVARTLSEEPFSAPAEAERRAMRAAEQLEIGVSRHLDRALEWSMKLAPVALSLALTSWQTLPVDAVTILAGDRPTKYASRALASRATGRQARLRDLAQAGPGRLEAAL